MTNNAFNRAATALGALPQCSFTVHVRLANMDQMQKNIESMNEALLEAKSHLPEVNASYDKTLLVYNYLKSMAKAKDDIVDYYRLLLHHTEEDKTWLEEKIAHLMWMKHTFELYQFSIEIMTTHCLKKNKYDKIQGLLDYGLRAGPVSFNKMEKIWSLLTEKADWNKLLGDEHLKPSYLDIRYLDDEDVPDGRR